MSDEGLEVELAWSPPTPVKASRGGFRIEVAFRLGAEPVILFGASGAGKSSILRLIAGLERPEVGRVRLGRDTLFDAARRINRPLRDRRVGLIFQDDLLFPHLSVAGNVRFGLKGWPGVDAAHRVEEVAALCEVDHLLDRRPETLSGGERQRVGLARALAPRPRLLLCDEPVSALDLKARDVLVDRLKAVQHAEGIPVLYVTHSPAEAIALGSRLFLLEDGKVVAEGLPSEVLRRSRGLSLGGIVNRFDATIAEHFSEFDETLLRIDGGPTLVVPAIDRPIGSGAVIHIQADDILLARGEIAGVGARNQLAATVERVVERRHDVEVRLRTDQARWIVNIPPRISGSLGLCEGAPVHMIIKSNHCRIAPEIQ